MIHKPSFFILALVFAGCVGFISDLGGATDIDPNDPIAVTENTEKTHDRYEGTITTNGPLMIVPDGQYLHGYTLRIIQKEALSVIQLIVMAESRDRKFLEYAYSEGQRYKVIKMRADIKPCSSDGCFVVEYIGISFTMPQLEKLANRDAFDVKIAGTHGHIILNIPGTYFQGVLNAFQAN